MGLAGGGPGAFIGAVHRRAAELDGQIILAAGAFSRDLATSRTAAAACGLSPDRAYGGALDMIAAEAGRPDGVDFVAIATPNDSHLPIALAAIEAGLPVISDKPPTATLAEARILADALRARPVPYALTFTYTGYLMLREARARIAAGDLGRIRRAVVAYEQGWLSDPIEAHGQTQAAWRTDPARAGVGGCVADIGVHAFNALEFVTGLKVLALAADLKSHVPGRRLDDEANLLIRLEGGATGVLTATQIATGARNNLEIRVYGERGGLLWSHERPEELTLDHADGRSEIIRAGGGAPSSPARQGRLPIGHPEGFIEAFATLYSDFAQVLLNGGAIVAPLQGVESGVRAMTFIEAAVRSSARGTWIALDDPEI